MKKNISRINTKLYKDIFKDFDVKNTIITFERPMINPTRFDSTLSAVRCLEAELICLEELGFGYRFIDSKEWQRKFLPLSAKGKELKKASFNLGIREFPYLEKNIKEVGDADAIFIAKYSKKYL